MTLFILYFLLVTSLSIVQLEILCGSQDSANVAVICMDNVYLDIYIYTRINKKYQSYLLQSLDNLTFPVVLATQRPLEAEILYYCQQLYVQVQADSWQIYPYQCVTCTRKHNVEDLQCSCRGFACQHDCTQQQCSHSCIQCQCRDEYL